METLRLAVPGGTIEAALSLPKEAPRGALVLLHGLASGRGEFGDAPEALAARGWAVLALDSRAHGLVAARDGTMRAEAAVEDLASARDLLRGRGLATGGLGLVAHSMGAALACLSLPRLPEFGAAALVAPADSVRGELVLPEYLMYRAVDRVSRAAASVGIGPFRVPYKYTYRHLFVDPERRRRAEQARFLGNRLSLGNFDAMFGIEGARWAKDVLVPTLVLLNRKDRAVKPASSRRVYEALAGPKRVVELDSGHSTFADRAGAEAVDLLDAWFREHLSPA